MHIHISVIAEALGESVRELIVRNENAAVIECVRILKNNAVPRESAKNDTCLYIVTVDSISIYNRDKENYKNLIAGVDIFDENKDAFNDHNVIIVDEIDDLQVLFSKTLDIFDEYNQWYEDMCLALTKDEPLDAMIATASRVLSNPVAIFDTSQSLMGYSANNLKDYESTIWKEVLSPKYPALNYYSIDEHEEINRMFRENDTCFIISPKRDLDHEHLMAPIKVNGAIVATIGMVDLNGPFTHAQIFIANVIHDMLEKLFAIRMNKRSADDLYYFTRMLSGAEVRSRTVSLHLATKGWGMNDGFFMLSFQVSEKLDYVNKWDLCITRIQESFPRSISSVYEETIVMVIRKQDYDILQPEERKKLDDLCDSYYLRCAISSYFDQFIDLHLCYEQNRMLLNLKLQNETQLLYWPDHYEEVLFASIDSSIDVVDLCYPKLIEIYRSDRNNRLELIECLYTYLICGRNMADTARRLFAHRNTLLYRLHVLEDLLGLKIDDLNEQELLMMLLSCLIIMRDTRQSS